MKNSCCFTGHRPQKLAWGFNETDKRCIELKESIKTAVEDAIENGYITFISGMALGGDMYFAEIILELKKTHPHIKLECAIPYENQASLWSSEQRARYYSILSQCDNEILLSKKYTHTCLMERNRYMVDKSELLIAVYYENTKGGAYNTVAYANKKEIKIVSIPLNLIR